MGLVLGLGLVTVTVTWILNQVLVMRHVVNQLGRQSIIKRISLSPFATPNMPFMHLGV